MTISLDEAIEKQDRLVAKRTEQLAESRQHLAALRAVRIRENREARRKGENGETPPENDEDGQSGV
jgi:hypothetical protein